VGHRGSRGVFAENTLCSIEEGHRQGADAVEIDVRPCGSGEIVVVHDPDMLRVSGCSAPVHELSLTELRRLDLGGGATVPTLEEVLRRARQLRLGVNIELKHDVPSRWALARGVASEVADFRDVELLISSFDPRVLALHRLLQPRLCHAQLIHRSDYHDWAFRIARTRVFDGVNLEDCLVHRQHLAWFERRGFVNAWTVNDATLAKQLFSAGVGAIITDVPQQILQAFTAEEETRAEQR
jgi:glycerophosphoryl diester phosphodiesterase